MSKIIIMEGVDGVGKSTVCKILAQRWSHTPIKPILIKTFSKSNTLERIIHAHATSFLYYVVISIKTLSFIVPTKILGRDVICDRYIQTVDTYSPDNGYWYNKILRRIFSIFFINPNVYIELTADSAVIKQRLKQQSENTEKYHKALLQDVELIKSRQKEYRKIFERMPEPKIRLDTTNASPEDIVEEIINFINNNK